MVWARCLHITLLLAATASCTPVVAAPVSPRALAVERQLSVLDVVGRWQAGIHVDWRTGLPDGADERLPGRHTHCSAFVAAAAAALGIYILRPPQHGQVLLANAQNEWLMSEGAAAGWRPLPDGAAAQDYADRGYLVVASYHSRSDETPGHIAIVLPGTKSSAVLAAEGPDVMEASTVNAAHIALRDGFAGHPGAFDDDRILFFAHATDVEGAVRP